MDAHHRALSLGALSLGALSLGALSLGALSLGALSLGALSLAAVSVGKPMDRKFEADGKLAACRTARGRVKRVLRGLARLLTILLLLSFRRYSPFSSTSHTQDNSTAPGWHKQTVSTLARLTSVFFIDTQHGWAAGNNGLLLKTEDGGATWQRLPLPAQFSRDLPRDLWAFDAQRLRLLGEYNLTQRPTSAELDSRAFLLASADGGVSWQEIDLARPPDKPLRRPRARAAIENELDQFLRLSSPILVSLAFSKTLTGWLVGESGTIQTTRDGGASWQMQYAASRKLFYDVTAIDAQQAWLVGGGGVILRTVDGGSNWNEQPSATTQSLRAVHFIDAKRGWAAGTSGALVATLNGGNRWQNQISNSTETLNDVCFVNANEGWAAGERGTLLHTRDGGVTWLNESLKTYASLNKLFFVAPDCGWVVGGNGSIFKYSSLR